jgi:hypothetical protein
MRAEIVFQILAEGLLFLLKSGGSRRKTVVAPRLFTTQAAYILASNEIAVSSWR